MNAIFLDFLNSDWRDYRGSGQCEDRLRNAEWMNRFLEKWKLKVESRPTKSTFESLTDLRSALRRMVEAITNGKSPADKDIERLNEALSLSTPKRLLIYNRGDYSIKAVAPRRDWNWVQSEIAASFADLVTNHDPTRIKRCENDDCRWVFYDESKSHSRRWCADSCGNLLKVRRFRNVQRQAMKHKK